MLNETRQEEKSVTRLSAATKTRQRNFLLLFLSRSSSRSNFKIDEIVSRESIRCKKRRFSPFSFGSSMTTVRFRAFSMCVHGAMSLFCRNLIRIFSCVDVWKWKRTRKKQEVCCFVCSARWWQKSHTKLVSIWICDDYAESAFNSSLKVVVFISLRQELLSVSCEWKRIREIDWLDRFSSL
jgi:hypothetical protein